MSAPHGLVVVDASVAVKWVLDEPGSAWARALPGSGAQLLAPDLLPTECGSVLWRMARTGRIDPAMLERFWSRIGATPLMTCGTGWREADAAMRLAMRLDHPIYDCLYLALALERGAALATADRRFLTVVGRTGVLPPDRIVAPPSAP